MSLMIVLALGVAGALVAGKWGAWPRVANPPAPMRAKPRARASFESGFPIVVLASLSIARDEERR